MFSLSQENQIKLGTDLQSQNCVFKVYTSLHTQHNCSTSCPWNRYVHCCPLLISRTGSYASSLFLTPFPVHSPSFFLLLQIPSLSFNHKLQYDIGITQRKKNGVSFDKSSFPCGPVEQNGHPAHSHNWFKQVLWRVPMGYKQLPKHVRIDRWMDCFNAVTVN